MTGLLLLGALFTVNPITLTVWPSYAQMRPATFVFVMVAPRHKDTLEACFAYDGPEYKSFCWSVDGAKSPLSWRFEWLFRSGGEYTATASVKRMEDGRLKTYFDARPFRVIGMDPRNQSRSGPLQQSAVSQDNR